MLLDSTKPFILLDDARPQGAGPARLYHDPLDIISASALADVPMALERLASATAGGLHAAGYIAYEAGQALDANHRSGVAAASARSTGAMPLLWFGIFPNYEPIAADAIVDRLPDPAGVWAGVPEPEISRADYADMLARIQDYIAAGDIYQANLSFRARVPVQGHPLALYARLRAASESGWGGAIFTGEHWLLSASPELFFTLGGDALVARPMKGTAARDADPQQDRAAAAALCASPKERAENLMIVDLLRNDLSRVASAGSVKVPDLFRVETYPTVHTLTSTVTANLAPGRNAIDVIRALFPCGSITGAPKIRAMDIIAEVEPSARGIYTGSMGWLDPAGNAAFNVVIRTLSMKRGAGEAQIGLGGAIVADSTLAGEWAEAHAKGRFVTAGARPFDLIETMAFDPKEGVLRLERHIARMKASADALGFVFDRHDARNELQAATFRLRAPARVRMLLSRSGRIAIEIQPMPSLPSGPVTVKTVPLPVARDDFRLRHKTTDRDFYAAARTAAGTFEVALLDEKGFVTEGSFTNIFVERAGKLLTPPLSRGLLPGVLRAELIETGDAIEADLRAEDLAGGFLIGNALRGLMPARIVPQS
ncbi:aminodeoxychorismate synthase component I [Sphingobium boeckii]|uniref:Probable branched-chain-amino-acid aminotransferase n=1 Tax=Sphingobium boeckii TaxID=1082345 RepID=A0A7W9EDX1_9SPHN|nr:aminodeoxychorismate synthase component I [Sphingobium boeckii]MBB5684395.1 para-aminobenzoate synthetase/4-amino-4-deoxychorismate lyase [Sphingobium boeckii]